jgi:aminotransferase
MKLVVFEPSTQNYGPDAIMSGATPRFVQDADRQRHENSRSWGYDENETRHRFWPAHQGPFITILQNNPTGKVFTRAELEFIRDLCVRIGRRLPSDGIYAASFCMKGAEHISMAPSKACAMEAAL